MTSTRVHIRGNTGTQLLQAAAALSALPLDAEPIICVNNGGLTDYDGTSKLDLFFELNCRVLDVDMFGKTPYWKPGIAAQIFDNREKIFQWLKPKDLLIDFKYGPAIHIRGGDKKIASVESYKELIKENKFCSHPPVFYTDDHAFTNQIVPEGAIISEADWFQDWVDIYSSPDVYAAPSSFIMSMLLFDPTKEITFMGERMCDGGYDISGDMIFLREALPYCRNVRILD